jgi:hypothetical protein
VAPPKTTSRFEDKRVFTQMMISKRSDEVERCPLCRARTNRGVIDHLKVDHRRTDIEAREIMARNAKGTFGWDPEMKKKKAALRTWWELTGAIYFAPSSASSTVPTQSRNKCLAERLSDLV